MNNIVNEAMFREMLLLSSGNICDYAAHIYSKYTDLDESSRTVDLGENKFPNVTY